MLMLARTAGVALTFNLVGNHFENNIVDTSADDLVGVNARTGEDRTSGRRFSAAFRALDVSRHAFSGPVRS